MKSGFAELIAAGRRYETGCIEGYSAGELFQIEHLYDIKVTGQLRRFLEEMGRCEGGLLGDDPVILYRGWSVRSHVLGQAEFIDDMQNAGHFQYLGGTFVFAIEYETQSMFVRTESDNPDAVYHFDQNTGNVRSLGMDLLTYLQGVETPPWGAPVLRGELIRIPSKPRQAAL